MHIVLFLHRDTQLNPDFHTLLKKCYSFSTYFVILHWTFSEQIGLLLCKMLRIVFDTAEQLSMSFHIMYMYINHIHVFITEVDVRQFVTVFYLVWRVDK